MDAGVFMLDAGMPPLFTELNLPPTSSMASSSPVSVALTQTV